MTYKYEWMYVETSLEYLRRIVSERNGHKYGRRFIAYNGDVQTARWWVTSDGKASNFIGESGMAIYPSHWCPLPPPPEEV